MNVKFGIINLLLCMAVAYTSYRVHDRWQTDTAPVLPEPGRVEAIQSQVNRVRAIDLPETTAYSEIVSSSLFHPERIEGEVPDQKAKSTGTRKISRKQKRSERVYLYGVIEADGVTTALIGSNTKNQKTGKHMQWVEIGDAYGDLEIVAITNQEMTLNRDGVEMKIALFDPSKPKLPSPKKSQRQKEPRVITGSTKGSVKGQPQTAPAKPQAPPPPSGKKIQKIKRIKKKPLPKTIALPQVSQVEPIPVRKRNINRP